jgi:hypothetical protein
MSTRSRKERGFGDSDEIPNLGHNPSPNSRIGDIGYVDQAGSWRRVLNCLDSKSCGQLGLKALRLAQPTARYITSARQIYMTEPVVKLDGAGSVQQVSTGEALAK